MRFFALSAVVISVLSVFGAEAAITRYKERVYSQILALDYWWRKKKIYLEYLSRRLLKHQMRDFKDTLILVNTWLKSTSSLLNVMDNPWTLSKSTRTAVSAMVFLYPIIWTLRYYCFFWICNHSNNNFINGWNNKNSTMVKSKSVRLLNLSLLFLILAHPIFGFLLPIVTPLLVSCIRDTILPVPALSLKTVLNSPFNTVLVLWKALSVR